MLKKKWRFDACFGVFFLLTLQLGAVPIQRVEERLFGRTPAGEDVQLYTLRNAHGMVARVMGYGATITELRVTRGLPGGVQRGGLSHGACR